MRVESKIFRMDRALLKIAIQKGRLRCFSPKSDNIHFFFFFLNLMVWFQMDVGANVRENREIIPSIAKGKLL